MTHGRYPKIIWIFWQQGWDDAPDIVRASLKSWRRHNPDWVVRALTEETLSSVLPRDALDRVFRAGAYRAAFSDCVRIELLHRYGGVWVDATTICMEPLDDWLPQYSDTGFFAFSEPTPDRMLSSWFLAAEKGSYVVSRWREAVVNFWSDRVTLSADEYFWFHELFALQCSADEPFRRIWQDTKKFSAVHRGHYGPGDERLVTPATPDQLDVLANPPAPVFKLTYQLPSEVAPGSFIDLICARERQAPAPLTNRRSRRLLVTWFGSFDGHGTLGDLLALESLVTHLVGNGHSVSHATAMPVAITGATQVHLHDTPAKDFDGIMFVCGPIIPGHPHTSALFVQMTGRPLLGVGVSLLGTADGSWQSPFHTVLAREGGDVDYGDIAIVAPERPARLHPGGSDVGMILRGAQSEYGEDRCRWRETEAIARSVSQQIGPEITIENHLARSGLTRDQIIDQYETCALTITSRFHGAIESLRTLTPFIAIDQIEGGAKVHRLVGRTGWPHVYKIDEADPQKLSVVARELVEGEHQSALVAARNRAVRDANVTLAAVDDWVASLP